MKFKIGDKVKIRYGIRSKRDIEVTSSMKMMEGEIFTIKEFDGGHNHGKYVSHMDWSWDDDWLEPIPDKKMNDLLLEGYE